MTTPPPDGYSRDELLAFKLPDLDALRTSVMGVVETFQEVADTLTPTGNPGATVWALNRAANAMVGFALEYERYWTAAAGVQAEPVKAAIAQHEQSRKRDA